MADDTRVTHSRSGIACTLALLWVLGCALPASAFAGDIIVARDAGLDASERADVRADAGVTLERMLSVEDAEVVTVADGREASALAALNADPDVRYAVPDVAVHATDAVATAPNDQYYLSQWALEQSNEADIDVLKAWDFTTPLGSGVTVGVVDQRIDVSHLDLKGNIEPGGQDFTKPDDCTAPTPTGLADHGTHVAGTIAAERDNAIGIAGIAPLAHVLPLQALDNCGGGKLSWVLEAFEYAGANHIPIVSASFATEPVVIPSLASRADPPPDPADINTAFADVFEAYPDTLYVVAAGNEGNDNDVLPVYPCNTLNPTRTDPDNLVCVGMTNASDVPVCWGNTGDGSVDVYAPGISIISTVAPNDYLRLSGTSMATPMVAATAALMASLEPGTLSVLQIEQALIDTGDDLDFTSTGRLNAARAVERTAASAWPVPARHRPGRLAIATTTACSTPSTSAPTRPERCSAARTSTATSCATARTTAWRSPTPARPTPTATEWATPAISRRAATTSTVMRGRHSTTAVRSSPASPPTAARK